jgi:hypothetical protein
MKRRARVIASVAVLVLAIPGVAGAAWLGLGGGQARARSDALGTGVTPTVAAIGRNVQVSWTATTFLDGTGASGYTVRRYTTGGVLQTILSACTGTVGGLTCTEAAVPAGSWKYSVTPKHGTRWSGTEGPRSATVTIAAPSFAFDSSTTITSLPATRTGTLGQFATGESVTFRLDSPTGTVLTGSHAAIGAGGTATTSTTIPAGTAQGAHTVYAVGSLGSQASASITVDTQAPTVSAAVIQKSAGGDAGYLKQSGTYYVYANASDAVSSVASVTADVSTMTAGATASVLSAGSWTVGGTTYGYRSALLTTDAAMTAGPKAFSITAADTVGNSGTTPGFSATGDITAPAASNIQITDGGGTIGKPKTGDVVTFTFTDTIDAESVLAGWSGAATPVTVQLTSTGGSDRLNVFDAAGTTLLPLGQVRLNRTDYVAGTVNFAGSTMTRSGTTITVVLGTTTGTTTTAAGTATMRWTTVATATDRAGNACTVANLNEPGAVDMDF